MDFFESHKLSMKFYEKLEDEGFLEGNRNSYDSKLEPGVSLVLEFGYMKSKYRKIFKLQEKTKAMIQAEKIRSIFGDGGTVQLYEKHYKLLGTF